MQVLYNLLFLKMYVVNYMKYECCCPSWGVEICTQPDSEHLEPDLWNADCICSCHWFINFSFWMPMSVKYADIKMYVLKITLNALKMAQTMTQGWDHLDTEFWLLGFWQCNIFNNFKIAYFIRSLHKICSIYLSLQSMGWCNCMPWNIQNPNNIQNFAIFALPLLRSPKVVDLVSGVPVCQLAWPISAAGACVEHKYICS